ncbi:uncharacterized protein FIBRA_02623 [Fibroporia radiculosa]|uniref:Uncharacterized protein n=1 Tax=Fibroporia radiculosa TaxID=599839 RepID=J4HV79_9APHY|nr:uncharacterized protein FIBRA_02623 [Fibroporia radiculosa]CCM00587.1 predicted protein [Fibroporia radiculosa]
MRYTLFQVPLPLNPKHGASHYLKSENQTLWSRNAARAAKAKGVVDETVSVAPSEGRRGSKVIVVHPGSRFLRIGKASDVTPLTIPSVVARKHRPPVPAPQHVPGIARQREGMARATFAASQNNDEYAVQVNSDDPYDSKVAAILISLRDRMRFYKLRVTQNAASIASTFNEQFIPETIPESNDPFRIDWIHGPTEEEYVVGEKALRLADPPGLGYVVKWPFYCGKLNTRDYSSIQLALNDIETLLRVTLKERLGIDERAITVHDYSVVLVIPDFYDRSYVHAMVRMLLVSMGFKQLCAQQESLAATYGAGISNACVVDMGATKTSIACVDDGLVLSDTRMSLNMGGDDITEFLYVLLHQIRFPYKDVNLARSYDWNVLEDLKARLCTLAEGDVALNLYDFVVRRPGQPAEKYGLRAYDEIILAPMCLFEPRVIEFDQKRQGMSSVSHPDVTEDIVEQSSDHFTQAMVISTQHLLPAAVLPSAMLSKQLQSLPASGPQTPGVGSQPTFAVSPQPAQGGPLPQPLNLGSSYKAEFIFVDASNFVDVVSDAPGADLADAPIDETRGEAPPGITPADSTTPVPTASTTPVPASAIGEGTADVPMEILDHEEGDIKPSIADALPIDAIDQPVQTSAPVQIYPGGYTIDVCFEASKLPLDVAVFNSARAAGGDEKIRKYLQAVLIIGGTALVPGMAHALESRLQAIATPLVPNMEKVQIIPPPKDVDPRVLAWKGAAVLGKMDGVADLWITAADWDILGMRGLKERCFFL